MEYGQFATKSAPCTVLSVRAPTQGTLQSIVSAWHWPSDVA